MDYDDLGLDWVGGIEPFDDSAWAITAGQPNGVGYDRDGSTYDALIGLDLEVSPTTFLRATFDVGDRQGSNL